MTAAIGKPLFTTLVQGAISTLRNATDLPIFILLLAVAVWPAYAQKCQGMLPQTSENPFDLPPPGFTLKLNKPIGNYGDTVHVETNRDGKPSAITFETNPGFTNSHVFPLANSVGGTMDFIKRECPDGYTLESSVAQPR